MASLNISFFSFSNKLTASAFIGDVGPYGDNIFITTHYPCNLDVFNLFLCSEF